MMSLDYFIIIQVKTHLCHLNLNIHDWKNVDIFELATMLNVHCM